MNEANRLSPPGERAALQRVEAIVERMDEVPVERFAPSLRTLPLPAVHARLVAELEAEADRCGRRELLDDVRNRVRDAIHVRQYGQLNRLPTGMAGYAIMPVRPDDAAIVEMALVDAVAVALMEDRLSAETAARLSAPGRALLGLPSLGEPVGAVPPDTRPGEPSPEEWAEAADALRTGDHSDEDWAAAAGDARRKGDPSGDAWAEAAAEAASPGRLIDEPSGDRLAVAPASPAPRIDEPSPSDWAEAADGDTQTGDYTPIPVGLRVGLAVVAACTIGPAALLIGVAGGSTLVGIAAGLAVVALCWLFATYRR